MHPYISFLNTTVNNNHELFSNENNNLNWVNGQQLYILDNERSTLLQNIDAAVNKSYRNSKLWTNSLSKGCQLCAEGKWSCLFINNICNATCVFCPTQQDTDEIPSTQGCTFNTPEEFAEYINYFQFKGVSISGGEPLKTLDKTLRYIQAVRKHCDPDIYFWLYTNGILGTREIFEKLGKAGVNEVRFNLAASNYTVALVENAAPYIEHITVEIPAIPEDYDKVKSLIPALILAGVTNLNLHQLRLTPYNIKKLSEKGYTFTHGNPPTVIESEITAIKLLKHVIESGLQIGINYCNYHYKNNFQKAGFRKHIAKKFEPNTQDITAQGYIRQVTSIDSTNKKIDFQSIKEATSINKTLKINYKYYSLSDKITSENDFNLEIGHKKYNINLKNSKSKLLITPELFIETLKQRTKKDIDSNTAFEIFQKEIIEDEFPEYF